MRPEWREALNGDEGNFKIEHDGLIVYISEWNKKWSLSCSMIGFRDRVIPGRLTTKVAKSEAVKIVRQRLADLLRAANELPL